eukprot:maker-scaffold_15-snap-gene-6.42-mRNA-1 protein AED:0.44 eAED:0.45 QI:0/0/0/1/1/1/2/0/192
MKNHKDIPEASLEPHKIIPSFTEVLHQHINSYNHLVSVELKQIIQAVTNREVRSEEKPEFFLQYDNIYLTQPSINYENTYRKTTPNECRLRNLTYSAPLLVDIRYSKQLGDRLVVRRKTAVEIGRVPVLVRSKKCVLNGLNEKQRVDVGECGFDPGGYFIVKGKERVIQIHEQQSRNKILLLVHTCFVLLER